MEDNKFLLTFRSKDCNGNWCYKFIWYPTEEEMREHIKQNPQWQDLEATEILNCRNIDIFMKL